MKHLTKHSISMKHKAIHRNDAIRLLEDGHVHKLRVWEIGTGEIITYERALAFGKHTRRGLHRVKIYPSMRIHAFRDVTLFEIDDLKIFM